MLIVRSSRMLDVRLFSKSHPDIINSVGVVNRRLYYDDVILDDTRTYVRVERVFGRQCSRIEVSKALTLKREATEEEAVGRY